VQRQRIENFKNGRCFNSAVAEQKTPQETAAFFFILAFGKEGEAPLPGKGGGKAVGSTC
jgi:hypothetical protein